MDLQILRIRKNDGLLQMYYRYTELYETHMIIKIGYEWSKHVWRAVDFQNGHNQIIEWKNS